ncbi:MAG: hypothetical protein D5S00_08285 [Tindallia sp. MSAO_Bac2]|nr:MAG: hypothetical protein D5S00_08285 [Tindallia sp. MSAO_Bac2]
MIRIYELKIAANKEQNLEKSIAEYLKIKPQEIIEYRIYKRSVDARKKDRIMLVYIVDLTVKDEKKVLHNNRNKKVEKKPPEKELSISFGDSKLPHPPVIIGTGPAGLFCGLLLAEKGYRPILLERGEPVDKRIKDVHQFWKDGSLNTESNVQFGEGGAGTFSDGKLTTRINDPRCRYILKKMKDHGAPNEILYDSKPHIGTDKLRKVVAEIREAIIRYGGEIRYRNRVERLQIENNHIKGIEIEGEEAVETSVVVASMGHSARDLFESFYDSGVPMESKAFSIGARIEHPQELINEIQYGTKSGISTLGAADYRLSWHHPNGRGAYTFCMCPGGMVVASASEKDSVVTNGMSAYGRNGKNANSALLVSVTPEDFDSENPLAGIDFQRKWERKAFVLGGRNYRAPAQRVEDFLSLRASKDLGEVYPTYRPGVNPADLSVCLPSYVSEVLREALMQWNRKMKGFALNDAILTGVETRSSSPVRIKRNELMESDVKGLYPAGEGCGYAGGIMSAAVDGVKIAEAIMEKYYL